LFCSLAFFFPCTSLVLNISVSPPLLGHPLIPREHDLATERAKAALARVEYNLHQTNKKGLIQIERLEEQVITEVQERIRVEGEMVQERRDMSFKKRETDKQTRQVSIDLAQLGLERKRYVAHADKLAFDKKALLRREKNNNIRISKAKRAMSVQSNVGLFVLLFEWYHVACFHT
jgi:hypothetical protein